MGWKEVGSGLERGREGWKEVGSGLERGREWVGKRSGVGRRAGQGRRFPRHACTSISALGLVCLVKVLGFRVCGLSFGSKVT